MSLEQWARNGWLRKHKTSAREVADLLAIVDRDLKEAERAISNDWKFGIAYNAALKLCTILLNASGYRPDRLQAHFRTLQSLPLILGSQRKSDADYRDACRKTRNTAEYESVGIVTDAEAKELIDFTKRLRKDVIVWLRENHSNLLREIK